MSDYIIICIIDLSCHPCAGAMLIFSASFQFERMIPEGNALAFERQESLQNYIRGMY